VGSSVTTNTPFSNQDTNGVLVNITSSYGAVGTAHVVTGGDLMVNLETVLTSNGAFRATDVIQISENGGTGVAHATVASIHENKRIGPIATVQAFNTDNPFTAADTAGVAVTLSPGSGVTSQIGFGATGTATIAGPTLLDSVQITAGGHGFMVDDIIQVTEDGGAGIGHIRVASIA